MIFAFKIASRFLFSSKGQTILIVLGIAVGVSVQVFIGSLIQGLQLSLIDKTVGNSSQVTIYAADHVDYINQDDELLTRIKGFDQEIEVVSPVSDANGFIKNTLDTKPILLRGLNLEEANMIYEFNEHLTEGDLPNAKNEVLVGVGLKEDLNLRVGDEVTILTPSGTSEMVTITGFYDLNVARINSSWIITDLQTTQTIFDMGGKLTSIEIQVEDVFTADGIAEDLSNNLLNSELTVTNWKAQNEELLSGLEGQSISSIVIQVFVLISVVLGIASVLAISVMQKSKQLGILKAMGIKDRQASLIYLFQGLILGLIGAILGVLIGLFLSVSFSTFVVLEDGSPVVPLYIDKQFIGLSGLIAIASATFASLIPARRSKKLDPIEVIRNG